MTKTIVLIALLLLATSLSIAALPDKPRPPLIPAEDHPGLWRTNPLPTGWRRHRVIVCTGLAITTNLIAGVLAVVMQ